MDTNNLYEFYNVNRSRRPSKYEYFNVIIFIYNSYLIGQILKIPITIIPVIKAIKIDIQKQNIK